MMNIEMHLRIAGLSMVMLSISHVFIAKRLAWKRDVSQLTPINQQVFYVHAFFICLILMLMGILCMRFPQSLITPTPLARLILSGLVIFWATRLVFQWLVYDSSHWRGNRTNTIVHVMATVLWSYYTVVFAAVLRSQ